MAGANEVLTFLLTEFSSESCSVFHLEHIPDKFKYTICISGK